jgi:NAD(P)-dependent dehydrogenase (short-subunit alcohol dehydrogenase family)
MTMPRFSLQGRRALVTGASSGIGRAVALGLAEQGAKLVLHHFGNGKGANEVAELVGAETPVIEADFTKPGAAHAVAAEAVERFGPIDILIANAAIEHRRSWSEIDEAHVQDHVEANLSTFLALTATLVPPMTERGWGRVIATGSIMAARPRSETAIYAALKSAQFTALRAIARDVARQGVTMNVVSPGAIEIEANALRYSDADFRKAVVAKIPVGRQGKPDDLVGAFVFLCSDAASYITGANIPVDGGWSIGDAPGALPEVRG